MSDEWHERAERRLAGAGERGRIGADVDRLDADDAHEEGSGLSGPGDADALCKRRNAIADAAKNISVEVDVLRVVGAPVAVDRRDALSVVRVVDQSGVDRVADFLVDVRERRRWRGWGARVDGTPLQVEPEDTCAGEGGRIGRVLDLASVRERHAAVDDQACHGDEHGEAQRHDDEHLATFAIGDPEGGEHLRVPHVRGRT